LQVTCNKRKFNAQFAKTKFKTHQVLLIKPLTFMNLSGNALRAFVNYFKINPSDILVIYDDVSLNLGSIRLRSFGGAGGHKGMRSIIENLNSNEFSRLRVGIHSKDSRGQTRDLAKFVLSTFANKQEIELAESAAKKAKQAVLCWIESGIDISMTRYNKKEGNSKS